MMGSPKRDDVETYTVEEANDLLPEVRERLARLREAVQGVQFARGQVGDLEANWTEGIRREGSPEQEAYSRWKDRARQHEQTIEAELSWFQARDIEVKDPVLGLVDFYTFHGDDLVYLCWKEGEEEVEAWHTLDGGYKGRRPVDELG